MWGYLIIVTVHLSCSSQWSEDNLWLWASQKAYSIDVFTVQWVTVSLSYSGNVLLYLLTISFLLNLTESYIIRGSGFSVCVCLCVQACIRWHCKKYCPQETFSICCDISTVPLYISLWDYCFSLHKGGTEDRGLVVHMKQLSFIKIMLILFGWPMPVSLSPSLRSSMLTVQVSARGMIKLHHCCIWKHALLARWCWNL